MAFPSVCVVLVEPQGAGNIGSVCRVMMNFGISELRLVRPRIDHLGKEARDMAVNAKDLLARAAVFDTLADAVADCTLSLGTTRRFGKYRSDLIGPHQIAPLIAGQNNAGQTALVFGREDDGLTTAELDLCHHLVTIATDPALPSLNLAQAAAICLYELSRGSYPQQQPAEDGCERADSRTLESMYGHMRATLLAAGFLDPQNPDHILRAFRRIFGRSGLNPREVRILQGLWSRIDWLNSQQKG